PPHFPLPLGRGLGRGVENATASMKGSLAEPDRKIAYTPRPRRSPSKRRPQIQRLLLTGLSLKQIASHLGLVYGTVLWYAQQIYKQHHVRTLNEFLQKHGLPPHIP